MRTSDAANSPSDIQAQFTGETRVADGYAYWTTNQEDEDALVQKVIQEEAAASPQVEQKVKKPRKKILKPGAGRRTAFRLIGLLLIAILASAAYFGFNYFKVSDATALDSTQEADAVIVLGAAQYNGSPSGVLQERLDHAYNLYVDGTTPLIFTTGAGAPGDITTEGLVGLEHLLGKGVPESAIVLIPEGANTWEQLSASAFQIEELDLDSVLLVSDEFHSYRLLAIADELGINAFVSPSANAYAMPEVMREAAAVSIGRITGYRRLSNFTD